MYFLDEYSENSFTGFGLGEKNIIYKGNDQSPGPAHFYTEPKDMHSKTSECWTFGTGKRNHESTSNSLGPGEYDPKIMTLTRSFKLRGKNADKIVIQNNTGPGSYDIPDTKTKIGTRFNAPKANQILKQRFKEN